MLPEHRPLYKIAQVTLILHLGSRGAKSSLPRLHLFNWAFKLPERAARLSQDARLKSLTVSAWGFDPALAIALRYARAERLVSTTTGGYALEELGVLFAKSVLAEVDALVVEKELLKSVGKNITEGMVESVAKEWGA